MPSAAAKTPPFLSSFEAWVAADTRGLPMVQFRTAFAAVWLVYDFLDLTLHATERLRNWASLEPTLGLAGLQAGLVVCELVMLLGAPLGAVRPAMALAAALRGAEWFFYFRLNDFAYYAVTALLLAHTRATGSVFGAARPASDRPSLPSMIPRWPVDVLLFETAWIYFATGLMKLNDTWLSGRHLWVRLQYLGMAHDWPFPTLFHRCADSLPCDSVMAYMGVGGELTLALLLAARARRLFVVLLALGIHGFGAIGTNVWFFGPSLIAQVFFLSAPSRHKALPP